MANILAFYRKTKTHFNDVFSVPEEPQRKWPFPISTLCTQQCKGGLYWKPPRILFAAAKGMFGLGCSIHKHNKCDQKID